MSRPPLGFIPDPLTLALDRILPSRKTPEGLQSSRKFKQIVASMEAIGLIEPLSVSKADKATGKHILLDGHMRLLALHQLGYVDAPCLIATDDETYTYNNRINRISFIQEHHMLRRAVERGVAPERLAKALNVDISLIHKKVSLLDGICPEAVEMLKDQHFAASLGSVLRKLKPTRQVECVELMLTTNSMTDAYAEAFPGPEVVSPRPRFLRSKNKGVLPRARSPAAHPSDFCKLQEESCVGRKFASTSTIFTCTKDGAAKWATCKGRPIG